jgi:hypothetical protein
MARGKVRPQALCDRGRGGDLGDTARGVERNFGTDVEGTWADGEGAPCGRCDVELD